MRIIVGGDDGWLDDGGGAIQRDEQVVVRSDEKEKHGQAMMFRLWMLEWDFWDAVKLMEESNTVLFAPTTYEKQPMRLVK